MHNIWFNKWSNHYVTFSAAWAHSRHCIQHWMLLLMSSFFHSNYTLQVSIPHNVRVLKISPDRLICPMPKNSLERVLIYSARSWPWLLLRALCTSTSWETTWLVDVHFLQHVPLQVPANHANASISGPPLARINNAILFDSNWAAYITRIFEIFCMWKCALPSFEFRSSVLLKKWGTAVKGSYY